MAGVRRERRRREETPFVNRHDEMARLAAALERAESHALGAIVILAGIGIMSGNLAARIVAVIVVGVSLIVNFAAIPVYPVWSLVAIAIELLVLWALIVHGRELKT